MRVLYEYEHKSIVSTHKLVVKVYLAARKGCMFVMHERSFVVSFKCMVVSLLGHERGILSVVH